MPEFSEYARWYYMVYLLPGGLALFLLLASALGHGMDDGDNADGGHTDGGHADAGNTEGGNAGGGYAHHGVGPGHLQTGHARQGTRVVAAHQGAMDKAPFLPRFFGIGRVPTLLLWGSALLGWGVAGFWGTQLWQSLLHAPAAFVWPALATALAGAFVTEKVTVEAVARFLPGDESYDVSTVGLCGLTGTATFPVDEARGRVHVYDVHGTLHDVPARLTPGQAKIARGRRVLVTDYDPVRDQLIVEDLSVEETPEGV